MPSIQSRLLNGFFRLFVRTRIHSDVDVTEFRGFVSRMDRKLAHPFPGQTLRKTELSGVPCDYLEQAGSRPDRVILYLHGGGFVFHTPNIYAAFLGRLCEQVHATAWLPDYRLAPEHPFPAAPDDCFKAYKALLDKGLSADRIVVMGDSAGGCLTLTTLQRAHKEGLPMPACAVTLSPGSETGTPSSTAIANARHDPMFKIEALYLFREAYLQGANALDPKASPYYGSFEGFPPLLMFAGSTEMLLEDTVGVARRANFDGARVHAQVWNSMIHVFPLFDQLPESRMALETISGFINSALDDPAGISLPDEIPQGTVVINGFS